MHNFSYIYHSKVEPLYDLNMINEALVEFVNKSFLIGKKMVDSVDTTYIRGDFSYVL